VTAQPIRVAVADFWHDAGLDAAKDNPLVAMIGDAVDIELTEAPAGADFVLHSVFGSDHRRFGCRRVFYTGENVSPRERACDWSFSFEPTAGTNTCLPVYRIDRTWPELVAPRPDPDDVLANKTRFCNFVYDNPNPVERKEFFAALARHGEVDAPGKVLTNMDPLVPGYANKMAFIRQHKFTIAFENEASAGYTTEKLTHALAAGTVPIYWGDPHVTDVFNPECFIHANAFGSWEALAEFVAEVDKDAERYRGYLAAPIFAGGDVPSWLSDQTLADAFGHAFARHPGRPVHTQPLPRARETAWRVGRKLQGRLSQLTAKSGS